MNDLVKQCQKKARTFKQYGFDIYVSRRFAADCAAVGGGKILEVGTGKGFLTVELAKRGYQLTSIDIDRGAQNFARAMVKFKKLEKRVTFKVMDCRSLQFKNRAFDHVMSMDFFHHLKSPVKCLREMMRVTKRKLIIADLNKAGAELFEKVHTAEGRTHDRSRVTFSDIKDFFGQKGFQVKTYRKDFHTVLVAEKGRKK